MSCIWNEIDIAWNEAFFVWNAEICVIVGEEGGRNADQWLNPDLRKKEPKELDEEEFIKVFLTVHNKFLTPQQKKFLKIAQAYPTYEEQKQIKRNVKVALESVKLIQPELVNEIKVNIENVKIGLKKITEYVKNNTKK